MGRSGPGWCGSGGRSCGICGLTGRSGARSVRWPPGSEDDGANRLGPPADREPLAQLLRLVPRPADDVIDFHRYVGGASLPDIGNGYFVHVTGPLARQAQEQALRIGPPHEVSILVFGSDGGGALYAVPVAAAGPVYRLRDCAIADGLAEAGDVRGVAAAFQDFLERLRVAVATLAATAELTDL